MQRLKDIFLRIKLFFYDLFVYKIPQFFSWLKEKFKTDPWFAFGAILLFVAMIFATFEAYQYSKYTIAQETAKKMEKEANKRNAVMDINKVGPEKYLEEQLSCNNEAQVKRMFNNSRQWQGQYQNVIDHCAGFTKNSQYQKYLNPIIKSILNGPLVSQEDCGINFATKMVDPNSDDATEGIMLVLINSKKPNEVRAAKDLINSHPKYEVKVYDSQSPNGKQNFQNGLISYLYSGEGERQGFYSGNDWAGVAYAFNDNEFVWHSKELKDFPKDLPDKSLSNYHNGHGVANVN